MNLTNLTRRALWLTTPFNFVAASAIAFPESLLGQFLGFPSGVPLLYAYLLGLLVAVFGGMYGWTAAQPVLDRRLVTLGAIGKVGVFVVAASLWLVGESSGRLVLVASGDLAFATVWIGWLLTESTD